MKYCNNKNCSQVNPQNLQQFHKNSSAEDGFSSRCKSCIKEFSKKYYDKNKKNLIAKSKIWKNENKQHVKDYDLKVHLSRNFNLTLEDYNLLVAAHQNKCAICKINAVDTKTKKLEIDHNHKTNKIRGLLCGPCNRALGLFRDNISILESAITYIKERDK